ncbi:stamen-specific protein FIL1 [Cajanus cajan]|uniref:stamen-specific protein FIL1 n=1 Tax=Cajanus cajan TaxID=3821 RepID=UPI00098D9324|nr:stamen-specific protein FIL1 [Cajanus cajan]
MASSGKSLLVSAVLLVLVVAHGTHMARAQSGACSNELANLNVCAPFVVPGAANTNPNAACCNALHSVDRDCLCNTIRVASQLPSQCQLPPLACGTN